MNIEWMIEMTEMIERYLKCVASALRAVKAYWKPRPSGLMDRPLPRKVKSIPGHAVCSGCWEMMGNVLQVPSGKLT